MAVTILNTVSAISSKSLLTLEDPQTITGQKTFGQPPGSPPFVVTDPTAATVPNLDADRLDGAEGATYHDAALLVGAVPPANVDLSNLNANNLTSGTVPDARFPAVLPAVNGSRLTGIAPHLGSHQFWISARGIRPHPAYPHGELTDVGVGVSGYCVSAIPFGPSGLNVCTVEIVLPKSCQVGVLSFAPYWFASEGSGGVVNWNAQWAGWEHAESLDAAVGGGGSSVSSALGQHIMVISPNAAIATTGSEAVHSYLRIYIFRNGGVSGDTYPGSAYLIGVRYTVNLIAGHDT